ncbi:bone morphogenetic protein 10-like [Alosa sapidissima]|uniref:bone morphogenetic protein 10-like n=1 Tax=Alosa sapidissima TaxID=34773 RepID=UPI001C09B00F|nr:bone morphogenetic protein 10-like [Alosa sapidissima]
MIPQLCTTVMVSPAVSSMSCIWVLGLCSGLLPWLCLTSPILPPDDNPRAKDIQDPSLLEQSEDVDMQELLGNFLSVLNLTDRGGPWAPGPPQPPASRMEPPEYMLELYNRFANDHTARPTGNTVRSFKNEDSSPTIVTNKGVRTHPLLFNISIPFHERVINAELRLYALVPQDLHCLPSGEHKVTIFEVLEQEGQWKDGGGTDQRRPEKVPVKREELLSRHICVKESGWEVFELTDVVQRWKDSDRPTHYLEVRIDSFQFEGQANQFSCDDESEDSGLAELDIDRDVSGKHNSVLIVFSDDQSKDHQEEKQEIDELIEHEFELLGGNELWTDSEGPSEEFQDEERLMQIRSNMIYDRAPRVRRGAADEYCKKTPLYVEFKEIGWDSWIVAPDGYQANACRGLCQVPLTPDVSPTKHATIQSLVSFKSPKRVSPPCCVPTKLDPISLLYKDQKGVVTLKHKYEDMVVAECGCR